jgi:hypothetical protein
MGPIALVVSPPSLDHAAALHGLLERIRNLNLTLISVNTDGPSNQDSDTEA